MSQRPIVKFFCLLELAKAIYEKGAWLSLLLSENFSSVDIKVFPIYIISHLTNLDYRLKRFKMRGH